MDSSGKMKKGPTPDSAGPRSKPIARSRWFLTESHPSTGAYGFDPLIYKVGEALEFDIALRDLGGWPRVSRQLALLESEYRRSAT